MNSIDDAHALTGRQRAVAMLVARGLSNTQVARALGVSVKTVEYHLGNVYAHLGVHTRAQLTRRVVEAELSAQSSDDGRRAPTNRTVIADERRPR